MRILSIWCLFLLVACAVDDVDEDLDENLDEESEDVISSELSARFVPASKFNHSGVSHSVDGSGVIVTRTRNGQPITTFDAAHQPLGSVSLHDGPHGERIRIATLESLRIDGKTLFRVWPGGASKQGWIESDDVRTGNVTLREETAARAGNGHSCGSEGAVGLAEYVVTPKDIIPTGNANTRWKVNSSTGDWYMFHPDWDHPGGLIDRVFLFWSWTRTTSSGRNEGFKGGGVVRTEMRAGARFIACTVQPIRTILRETAEPRGSRPGSRKLAVYAAYGKFVTPAQSFYGWTIVASRLGNQCQMHVACPGGPGTCPRLPLPQSCQ